MQPMEERTSPTPFGDFIVSQRDIQTVADQRCDDNRHLLAGRLPTGVKAFIAWRGDLER